MVVRDQPCRQRSLSLWGSSMVIEQEGCRFKPHNQQEIYVTTIWLLEIDLVVEDLLASEALSMVIEQKGCRFKPHNQQEFF